MSDYLKWFNERCGEGLAAYLAALAFFLPLSPTVTNYLLVPLPLLLLWGWRQKQLAQLTERRAAGLVAAFALVGAVSLAVAPRFFESAYNYVHLMGRYVLIYFAVLLGVQTRRQAYHVVGAVLASSLLVSAYGIYQYFHGVAMLTSEWVDVAQFPTLKTRAFSTLQNPNLLAAFLLMVMSLAGGIFFSTQRLRIRLPLLLVGAVALLCLIFTYSRGAWVSLVVITVICGFLFSRRLLWVLGPALGIIGFFARDLVVARVASIFNPTDTSATLRMALWESTWSMIADHPVTGIGWGAYQFVYPAYDFFIQDPGTIIFHAHNLYLNIAAELGLPGIALFLLALLAHVAIGFRVLRQTRLPEQRGIVMGLIAVVIGVLVNGMTDFALFNIEISMLFWLFVALIAVLARCEAQAAISEEKPHIGISV